jgi:ATP-dependent Lon protease
VRGEVGMTGEVTLQGQVLPIGGVKQKVLAAHRHGLRTIILPQANEVDLDDVPREIRNDLSFVLVEHLDEVLKTALTPPASLDLRVGELVGHDGRSQPMAELLS